MFLPRDYTLVFWAFGKHDPVALIQKMISLFREFGEEHAPKLLAGSELPSDDSIVRKLVHEWGDENGLAVGLTSPSGIALKITTVTGSYGNVTFHDTMRIGFHSSHVAGDDPIFDVNQLIRVFSFGVEVFHPFYGFGEKSDEVNVPYSRKSNWQELDTRKVPVAIEWLNYFGPEWVERLGGLERLLGAPAWRVEEHSGHGGVVMVLQETAFDYDNPVHLENRRRVEDYLGLAQLQREYLR